ncbi:MAG TPA: hypothetical protein VF735_09450 [Pyrinomonadaceae bacterium]
MKKEVAGVPNTQVRALFMFDGQATHTDTGMAVDVDVDVDTHVDQ